MDFYKLEWMKIRLSTYLWAILGIFVNLLALGILFLFIFQMEGGRSGTSEDAELFANWNGLLALIIALGFACFSIFAAILAAKVIDSEYCGRNAVILLTYPAWYALRCRRLWKFLFKYLFRNRVRMVAY